MLFKCPLGDRAADRVLPKRLSEIEQRHFAAAHARGQFLPADEVVI